MEREETRLVLYRRGKHMSGGDNGKGRALVTGASAGIGLELAREFARNGLAVILVARNEAKLNEVAAELAGAHGIETAVIACDLAERNGPAALFEEVRRRNLEVQILVNNAGVMETGAFKDADTETLLALVRLNVEALTALTSLFLKPMVARGKGRILNVASLAAFQPLPSMAAYAASKAYVLSLTEALAEELRGKGVTVGALCPGFTDTNLVESAKRENAAFRALPSALLADPKSVAREGYRACMSGDVIRVPGLALQMATGFIQAQRSITRMLTGLLGRRAL
jgi:short-subunit dehydrogenase